MLIHMIKTLRIAHVNKLQMSIGSSISVAKTSARCEIAKARDPEIRMMAQWCAASRDYFL